ncbi:MAG TPA: glycosyltransferase 87 family protein [Pirellulales bacterium]|nr:glycosyltransferase 87 family protein [Pirellulales bacterium]
MLVVGSIPSVARVFSADRHWTRFSLGIWIAVVAVLTIYAYCLPNMHTVYDIYLGAARRWLTGDDIYLRTREFYRYSPLFAVSLTPLAPLSDSLGAAIWKLVNCGLFAWGLGAWARRLVPARLGRAEIATMFMLALPLSLHSMYNSQANLMMLGSVLLGLASAAEGRWNRAAAWLAWATLIKGYPLALAMLVAGIYPRQFALKYVAALGLGLLLPFAAQNPQLVEWQYANWFAHLMDSTAMMRERLRSIDQLFVIYGQPLRPSTFALCGAAAGAATFGACLFIARRTTDARERLSRTFELFALWSVLFGPATESCTYVVAAPAIAWRLLDALRRPSGGATLALLVASLLMMGPMVTDMFGSLVRNFANQHGSQPLGGLLLLGYLLLQTWQLRKSGASAEPAAPRNVIPISGEPAAAGNVSQPSRPLRRAG